MKINKKAGWMVLFLGPSLAGFTLFYLIPFIMSFYNSLLTSSLYGEFAGLNNYIKLLKNPIFLRALKNTIIFTASAVPLLILLSLTFAIKINKPLYKTKMIKTLSILPLVCPTASVVIVWQIIFKRSGLFNSLLIFLGLNGTEWLNSRYSVFIMVSLFIWKNLGYNMILFLAGLNSIPKSYYDVAKSYGAGPLYTFFKVTLVYLMPTTVFVLIISIINSFKIFREIYLLTGAYPDNSLYMVQHYINNTFVKLDLQKLSSASFIMSLIIIFFVNIIFIKGNKKDLI